MPRTVSEILNSNLHRLLKEQRLSQTALAKRSNVNSKTVNNVFNSLERGISPTLDTLVAVAKGLRVSVADLLAGDERPVVSAPIGEPHLIARQLARLTEDFLLSSESGRREILKVADESASNSHADLRNAP
jgi:transcriptional regulator with XRE-family HTH domain